MTIADPSLLARILALLLVANGAPILATKLLAGRLAVPLDGGSTFFDGRRLFGAAKTMRGVVASVLCTSLTAGLFGLGWGFGAILAALALTGDLFASFSKRRLGLAVHARAFGLDQIPESLLPLLVLQAQLNLGAADIVVLIAAFILLETLLSVLLYRLKIRDRPY
ncbi:CDP-archaeol synthase [Aurantimonas sp. A3-2-R12]|uniref:CDP-archaeol synthase n=1 Tax=Aurantimonas sp. A3-2-R12 TaxID=3114362 RepID=UPI002E199085|nr:CDP-archaeol synthase [Aurantimonas sp. A3-2-R12]